MANTNFTLKVENLGYTADGEEILSGIGLEVKATQGLVIIGESGRGKSTLIRLLAGLITPSEGKISYSNENISVWEEKARTEFRAKNIGLAFQNPHIIPSLTARQNIELALSIHGSNNSNAGLLITKMMERFEIEHKANAYIDTLSGGEARRVALARAFVAQPKIVILDEPLTGLDQDMAKRIIKEMSKIQRETKALMIISTHDMRISDIGKVCLNLDKQETAKAVTIRSKSRPIAKTRTLSSNSSKKTAPLKPKAKVSSKPAKTKASTKTTKAAPQSKASTSKKSTAPKPAATRTSSTKASKSATATPKKTTTQTKAKASSKPAKTKAPTKTTKAAPQSKASTSKKSTAPKPAATRTSSTKASKSASATPKKTAPLKPKATKVASKKSTSKSKPNSGEKR